VFGTPILPGYDTSWYLNLTMQEIMYKARDELDKYLLIHSDLMQCNLEIFKKKKKENNGHHSNQNNNHNTNQSNVGNTCNRNSNINYTDTTRYNNNNQSNNNNNNDQNGEQNFTTTVNTIAEQQLKEAISSATYPEGKLRALFKRYNTTCHCTPIQTTHYSTATTSPNFAVTSIATNPCSTSKMT
jgi:hypothetical protein